MGTEVKGASLSILTGQRSKLGTVPSLIGGCPRCLRIMRIRWFASQNPWDSPHAGTVPVLLVSTLKLALFGTKADSVPSKSKKLLTHIEILNMKPKPGFSAWSFNQKPGYKPSLPQTLSAFYFPDTPDPVQGDISYI